MVGLEGGFEHKLARITHKLEMVVLNTIAVSLNRLRLCCAQMSHKLEMVGWWG